MSQALSIAHACGWNPATTLMVCITVFHAGNGEYGVMTSAEYDADPVKILHEFHPFQSLKGRRSHPTAAGIYHRFYAAALHHFPL